MGALVYVDQGERLSSMRESAGSKGELMRSQAVPTSMATSSGTIRRMVAAVARMASRGRQGGALRREEVTTPLTAGLSRGLTLLVGDPRTATRRR